MCAENRRIRDRSSPRRTPSPRALKVGQSASSLPVVDFTSIMELYISIFCKHLYFDPKVERDIHIILTDNSAPEQKPQSVSRQMFTPTTANYSTSKHESQQKANKHVPLFKFRNMRPCGF